MSNHEQDEGRDAHGPLRSFGRRRARRLTPRQTEILATGLEALSLDLMQSPPQPLSGLFASPVREVWLEIGFGGAEHLLWQARRNRDAGIIGCEPFIDGVVKALDGIRSDQLGNVRLHPDDVRDVLAWLPPASVSRSFVLFPDPWPKKRHLKRRLVQPEFLHELARVMHSGAELRLATDISDYARAMLLAVRREGSFRWAANTPADWRVRPPDWPETRYEKKAIRDGRRCYYFRFLRSEN